MNIYKKEGKIVFEIEAEGQRYNPYDEEGDYGTYPTLTGVIIRSHKNGYDQDEFGFSQTIDMSYKNKADQEGEIIISWLGEEAQFLEKCKELDINIIEYEACCRCGKTVYGSHTIDIIDGGKIGAVCYDCEHAKPSVDN